MGLQIGAATMKMTQKIKNRTTTQSNNSTPQYLSKENENTNLKRYMHPYAHCWRRQWHPTPVLLPGKSHGRRNLVGCSPWGHYESDTTEWLHFHFSLSHIGEGNGNPLQCSCLENLRDRGTWWTAIYGVTQGWTQLKWLSSILIAALFTIAKIWKQLKCPLIDKWIKKIWYIYYSVIKKGWNVAFCDNIDGPRGSYAK